MKLKRTVIIDISAALTKVRPHFKSALGAFTCSALRRRLAEVVDPINEARQEPAKIAQYNAERIQLCHRLSSKDAQGMPIINTADNGVTTYDLKEHEAEFDAAYAVLNEKYRSDLDEWNARIKEWNVLLTEDVDLPAEKKCLLLSSFKDTAPGPEIDILFPFIVDDVTDAKPAAKPPGV